MSATIHGAGAATALSTFNSVDSKKLVAPSRTNLPGSVLVSNLADDRSAFSSRFIFRLCNCSICSGIVRSFAVSLFDFDAARSKRCIVAGSDASKRSGSGLTVRHSQKLIPNAVAVMRHSQFFSFLVL